MNQISTARGDTYTVADRVLVWSESAKRWYEDGIVIEIVLAGEQVIKVKYNDQKTSAICPSAPHGLGPDDTVPRKNIPPPSDSV